MIIDKEKYIQKINDKYKNKRKQKKGKIKSKKRCYNSFICRVLYWFNLSSLLVLKKNINEYNEFISFINITEFKIPAWRDVTPIQRLAFFLRCLVSSNEEILPFTLNVSKFFMKAYENLTYEEAKEELRNRIYDSLRKNLSSVPKYAFVIEDKNEQCHLHGIIECNKNNDEINKLRHALKLATFGCRYEVSSMHKYILRIDYYDKKGPKGWLRYINKNNTSANSLFISTPLKKLIKEEYEKLYKYSKERLKNYK